MATIAIGALGTTNYFEAKYKFLNEEPVTSFYTTDALIQREHVVNFDKTVVLLTTGAKDKNWPGLMASLEKHSNTGQVCPVDIPDGKEERDLWKIFETIVESVGEGDDLYIDITQGFRHLPMLLLMACSYLRTARNVTIKSISYGAYEAKDDVTGICPVFELLPYVALFDWSSGARAFQRTGDAGVLAELLEESAKGLANQEAAKQLTDVSDKLKSVTLALELARPKDASKIIDKLEEDIDKAESSLQQYAKPFIYLKGLTRSSFDNVKKSLETLAASKNTDELEVQRELIKWYKRNNHLTLAVQLAREWLVSKYFVKNPTLIERRDLTPKNRPRDEEFARRDRAAKLLWKDDKTDSNLNAAYEKTSVLRNDIAHMGQTAGYKDAETLKNEIVVELEKLDEIE